MKITLLTPALVAILGFALASAPITAQAQSTTDSTSTAAPEKKDKAKKTPFMGSITAIDSSSVTVASKEKTLTLAITPETKFKKDKEEATLADFAVGDKVTGSYSKDESGGMTANSLHKKTEKTADAKPAASTSTSTN
jgi:ribosomal protein S1